MIKEILLAEALGGGGAPKSKVITATGWNELPAINKSEYFPGTIGADMALGTLTFSFGGASSTIPVMVTDGAITGGASSTSGTGATMILTYDSEDEEWSVTKAWTNLMGSWMDITSSLQVGASDIILVLYQ